MTDYGGRWMIIDMHVHSDVSDDGMASVETYMKWITKLRRNYRIDGIVFTEHRLFNSDADYEALARQYDILIFKGTEADTDCGHVLCYGMNEKIVQDFDLKNVHLSGRELINAMEDSGGIGIPAHPGRRHIGLVEHLDKGYDIGPSLRAAEQLNGGSSKQENARAQQLVTDRQLFGIGGSDAHFVSAVGKFMTEFKRPVRTMQDLVEQLYSGDYRPITLEEVRIQS
jgi:predicted metal-dependent phosphoesterase TrpH